MEISYSCGPLEDAVEILYETEKGNYMNGLDRLHIYKIIKLSNHMNNIFLDFLS
jgi:hypothetical protein